MRYKYNLNILEYNSVSYCAVQGWVVSVCGWARIFQFITFTYRTQRHPRRRKPDRRVARPQLPVAVVAPAVDAAAAQQGTRV